MKVGIGDFNARPSTHVEAHRAVILQVPNYGIIHSKL
jgi:hypothetical protein